MNKTAACLRIVSIVLNVLFLVFLVMLSISNPPQGSDIVLATILYIYSVFNLLALILNRIILTGLKGAVFSILSIIFNVVALLVFVLAIGMSDIPEPIGMRVFLLIWFLSPLFSCPAILLLRSNAKKDLCQSKLITCPHCGGEF